MSNWHEESTKRERTQTFISIMGAIQALSNTFFWTFGNIFGITRGLNILLLSIYCCSRNCSKQAYLR